MLTEPFTQSNMGPSKLSYILLWFVLGLVFPASNGIEVGSTVSCSVSDLEYLDISSLECLRCDDDR